MGSATSQFEVPFSLAKSIDIWGFGGNFLSASSNCAALFSPFARLKVHFELLLCGSRVAQLVGIIAWTSGPVIFEETEYSCDEMVTELRHPGEWE